MTPPAMTLSIDRRLSIRTSSFRMKEPTCKLVCTGCGLEMPYRDRSLAEQAAELHQLRDPEHVTFIVPPEWTPEEPVTHE